MIKNFAYNRKFKNIAFLLGCAIFFVSCEEDLASLDASRKAKNFPTQIIHNAKIVQRDSGYVKMRATAPIIEKFELIDTPYVVARKGVNIEFYDKKKPDVPGKITAKFARFTELKKFYEARGDVRIITNEGQQFAMQTVYWDQGKREIYSNDTVYVTDKDGSTLVSTEGMWAKDDFSHYIFYNNSGDMNVKKIPAAGQ